MTKRLFLCLLVLCMALSLFPFGALAAEGEVLFKIEDGAAIVTGYSIVPEGKIVIPETLGGAPVKAIDFGAFKDCDKLTEIVLPEGLERIGEAAFFSSGLEKINVPASIQDVARSAFSFAPIEQDEQFWEGDIFYFGSVALKTRGANEQYAIRPGTTYVNFELDRPGSLLSVTIPEGVARIGYDSFKNTQNLKAVKLPDSLVYLDDQSFIKSGVTSIVIPPNVKSIGISAFSGCNHLQSLSLSGSALKTIGSYAFFDTRLQMDTLTIPNSVKEIGIYAFTNGSFKNLILSEGMKAIPDGCFTGGTTLQTVRIPTSIQTIGDSAFFGKLDAEMTQVFYAGTQSEWNKVVIQPNNDPLGQMKVNCASSGDVNPFTDVKTGAFYYDPVLWAVNHTPQITNGTSATAFSPEATCTRGQVVTFLWRAMGCPEPKSTANPFTDVKAGDYFYKAVLWAAENGITTGTSKTAFSPNNPCTRAHVVTFLWRAHEKPAAGKYNPFKDVAAGQYYTDAVLWAVSKNITNGLDAAHFGPDNPCTRGQIVTFLYRDLKK